MMWMYSPLLRIMRLGSRFEELQDLFVLFRLEIGADSHVHHDHVPLRRAVVAGRSYIMTTDAVFHPKLRSTLPGCPGRNVCRLLIGRATDQPCQGHTRNDYDGAGQAEPFAASRNNFFHG